MTCSIAHRNRNGIETRNYRVAPYLPETVYLYRPSWSYITGYRSLAALVYALKGCFPGYWLLVTGYWLLVTGYWLKI